MLFESNIFLRRFLTALVIWELSLPTGAHGSPEPEPEHLLLMLIAEGEDVDSSSLIAMELSKRIGDMDVSVKVAQVGDLTSDSSALTEAARAAPQGDSAIGCFTLVESKTGTSLRLVLFDQKTEWSVVRRLDALDTETLVETVAVIIRTSLTVFMTEVEKSPERTEAQSPPAPKPTVDERSDVDPPQRSRPFHRFAMEAGYDVSVIDESFSPIHGVLLGGAVFPRHWVSLFARYVVSFPQIHRKNGSRLSAVHHPAELGMMVRTGWTRFNLVGGIAFGINYITHEYRTVAVDRQAYLQLFVAPTIALEFSPIDRLGVFLGAGVRMLLRRPRYISDDGGDTYVLAEPWFAAPAISVGVSWRLFEVSR